jgi:hypothetical protein
VLICLVEHFLLQLLFTVGLIVLIGLTVALGKHSFLRMCGAAAHRVEVVTGFIGTPIHELSHALFCILFGHKITELRLWSPQAENGNLGYVTHTYRRKNLWHQLGNFFIGIAPILGGGAVLCGLLWCLLPESAEQIFAANAFSLPDAIGEVPSEVLQQAWNVLTALFSVQNLVLWDFYFFLFLAILIILHMEISRSDLASGGWGFLFLSSVLLLIDAVLLFVFPEGLSRLTAGCVCIGSVLISFFLLALCLTVLLLVISIAVSSIRRRL